MKDNTDTLKRQETFYETIRGELEAKSFGKWAVVSNETLVGVFDTNREASEVVLKLTPSQTCLVKRIGYVFVTSHPFVRMNRASVRDL